MVCDMDKYIKSPINYVGNKHKLLNQILPLFPDNINTFFDVFGGSGTVLINTRANHYIYNDINNFVSSIFSGLVFNDTDEVIHKIENVIAEYALSKTNKEGFDKLRDDYNNGRNDWITLFALVCYSFNQQMRFNNNHQYNSSFGKNRAYFTDKQKENLYAMKQRIGHDIVIMSKSFADIDYSEFGENDFLYFDPPYYNSVGSYNDGKRGFEGWSETHEKTLLSLLDKLNSQGAKFALSNNLKYDNPILDQWKDKYNVHFLNIDYANCNYHKIDKSEDIEVLITNY